MSSSGHAHLCLAASLLTAVVFALVATTAIWNRPPVVDANGLTVPVEKGVSGPYQYLIGIWPATPKVGNLHLALDLTSEQGPVTHATVNVGVRTGGGNVVSSPLPAVANFLQPWTYELDINLRETGQWILEFEISSRLGETVVEVPLRVAGSPSGIVQDLLRGRITREKALDELTLSYRGDRAAAQSYLDALAPPGTDKAGGASEGGPPSWAIIGGPVALMVLGLGVWAFRRYQRPKS